MRRALLVYNPVSGRRRHRRLLPRILETLREGGLETEARPSPGPLAPHIPAMVTNIGADHGIAASQDNVKATTTEKLGFAGREEGIAAHAVVLLGRVVRSEG